VRIGYFPELKLRDARMLVLEHEKGVTDLFKKAEKPSVGRDGVTMTSSGATLAERIDDYCANRERQGLSKGLKQRTIDDIKSLIAEPKRFKNGKMTLGGAFYELRNTPLEEITGEQIRDCCNRGYVRASGREDAKGVAGKAQRIRYIRAIFRNFNVKLPIEISNSTQALNMPKVKSHRAPRLFPEDLPVLVPAIEALKNPLAKGVFTLMLHHGVRIGEATSVLAGDYNAKEGTLTFYDTKNRDDHTIYLTPASKPIVQEIAAITKSDQPLFKVVLKRQLDSLIGDLGKKFSAHDFRRLYANLADDLVSTASRNGLLNHKPSSIGEGYARKSPQQIREAAMLISNRIIELASHQ
jgi:integrase